MANFQTPKAPVGTSTVGADPNLFVFKNLHIIGTMIGSKADTDAALDFAARVCKVVVGCLFI